MSNKCASSSWVPAAYTSLIYAVGVAILNVVLGAMAGYAFGRMDHLAPADYFL